ncbi:MAG: hypothetical protein IPN13_24645 [Bacteroidetes bacterium]|nr:hypothetical protein [Bacteroidota bacterium]
MVRNNFLKSFILSFICLNGFAGIVNAGEPETKLQLPVKQFYVKAGTGYGFTNRMVKGDENTHVPGITFNMSLGYKISDKIAVSFGPSLWVDQNDLINDKTANGARPSNKKMSVHFTGFYEPFNSIHVVVNGGIGVGTVVYSPARPIVAVDGKQSPAAEYHGGVSYAFGLGYLCKIKSNLRLLPQLQYTGLNLNESDSESYHLINTKSQSFLLEAGINLFFDF